MGAIHPSVSVVLIFFDFELIILIELSNLCL